MASPIRAATAGTAAAAAALGTTELISGFSAGTPGAVASVGRQVIERVPGGLERWAIDTFGTGDKPALLASIVVVCLILGAGTGMLGRRHRSAAAACFAVFALLGLAASLDDPLVPRWIALLGPGCAAMVGSVLLWRFMDLLRPPELHSFSIPGEVVARGAKVSESPTDPHSSRRSFFNYAGGAAAYAASATVAGAALRGRSEVEDARRGIELPRGSGQLAVVADPKFGEIRGLTDHVTANDDFYLIDTALVKPRVDPESWRLTIGGMVDRELRFSLDDIMAMDLVDEEITMACVSNEVGGDLIGNAVWTGVPLADLLGMAGIDPSAEQVAGRSVDGWTCGFPIDVLGDGRPALLAVGMNGEPLPIRHGFPARVVVGGLYGYVSGTKWVESLELTTWDGFDGYWVPRGWSKKGPIRAQCRIDVPARSKAVPAGPTPIAGVAWAQPIGVARVEVQVDDGAWTEASLADLGNESTWSQWMVKWDATPGEHTIRARVTDQNGVTQTSEGSPPAPSGATGYHERRVTVSA